MTSSRSVLRAALLCASLLPAVVCAGWQDLAKGVMSQATGGSPPTTESQATPGGGSLGAGLSNSEVTSGLKSALSEGTKIAVETLGKNGGFLDNPLVRIEPPASLAMIDQGLRAAGQGAVVDGFVTSMNRAAEQAVPEAAEVFADAVSAMTMDDALKILNGGDQAATEYFRSTSADELKRRFLPIVKQATDSVGVTRSYKALSAAASTYLPQGSSELTGGLGSALGGLLGGGGSSSSASPPDLDEYVTEQALDGLFKVVAEQEKQIRTNPAARTTELLQSVFGG
jgi:hypothetical protein